MEARKVVRLPCFSNTDVTLAADSPRSRIAVPWSERCAGASRDGPPRLWGEADEGRVVEARRTARPDHPGHAPEARYDQLRRPRPADETRPFVGPHTEQAA